MMDKTQEVIVKKGKRFFGFNRNIIFTGFTSFLTDTSVKMVYSVMPMFLLSIGASKTSLSLIEGIAESTAALIKTLSGFWSDKIGKNKPFIFTLGNSTDALLMVKANEVGVKVAYIPLVYLVASIVSVMLAIPIGSLSDKIGKEKILIAGFLVYGVVYYGFGVTTSVGTIVALFALYGLYSAATDGIQKAFVSDIIDKNKQGTGLGLYNALLGATLLPASIIAGLLYDNVNSSIPFYFGAVTAVISAILFTFFCWDNKKRNRRSV